MQRKYGGVLFALWCTFSFFRRLWSFILVEEHTPRCCPRWSLALALADCEWRAVRKNAVQLRVCASLRVSLIEILKRGKFYIWQRRRFACIKCAQHFYVNILLIAVLGNKAVFIYIFYDYAQSRVSISPTADVLGFGSRRCHHSTHSRVSQTPRLGKSRCGEWPKIWQIIPKRRLELSTQSRGMKFRVIFLQWLTCTNLARDMGAGGNAPKKSRPLTKKDSLL